MINDSTFYSKGLELSDYLHLKPYSIGSIRRIDGYKSSYPESIEAWIRQIATAEFVFTDSFHGTVLSLLYNKNFIFYVGNPNRVSRVLSLLTILGLSSRIVTPDDHMDKIKELASINIDYSSVNTKLNIMRLDSIQKLIEALS